MPRRIYTLSERAIRQMQRDRALGRTNHGRARAATTPQDQQYASGMLFEIPPSGIPARDGDLIHAADCVTWRVNQTDGTLQKNSGKRTLWNTLARPLAPRSRILAHQEAWGAWVPGGSGASSCREAATWSTRALVPLADGRLGLIEYQHTLRFTREGCARVSVMPMGPLQIIDCGCTGGCEDDPAAATQRFTCDGPDPITGDGAGYRANVLEIVSVTASAATINDGDTVTFTCTWKLRDDFPFPSVRGDRAYPLGCCFDNGGSVQAYDCRGAIWSSNVSSELIAETKDLPTCIRKGQTYTLIQTWKFTFLDCLTPTIAWIAYIGEPCRTSTGGTWETCTLEPATSWIYYASDAIPSGSYPACNPPLLPPMGDFHPWASCDEGSSGGSSGGSGSSSGSGGGSSGSGEPSGSSVGA